MENEKIFKIDGGLISIAEQESDPSRKTAKFLLCPLDEANANGKGIKESDLSEDEMNTLIGQPLVTKVVYNEQTKQYDFSGHLMKKIWKYDESGNLVKFSDFTSTNPIGYHIGVGIEDVDFNGTTKRCLVATVTLWTRYYRAMEIIERLGKNLHTSWELSYGDSYKEDNVEWLTGILFLANCVLGTTTVPAFSDAGLLEVAEEQSENDELAEALVNDLIEINKLNDIQQQEIKINNSEQEQIIETEQDIETSIQSDENSVDNKLNENIEEKGGIVDMAEKIEKASINTEDLEGKVRGAIYATETMGRCYWGVIVYPYDYIAYAKLDMPSSTREDFTKFTFIVNSDDTISLTSQEDVKMTFTPMTQTQEEMVQLQTQIDDLNDELSAKNTELSTKVDEIVTLGESITSLKDSIAEKDALLAELEPLKIEKAEAEAKKAEAEKAEKKKCLSEMLVSSKYFTQEEIETSEEIKEVISSLDDNKVKAILAERVIAEAQKIKDEPQEKETVVSETKEKEIEVSTDLTTNYEYENSSNVLLNYARRNIKK